MQISILTLKDIHYMCVNDSSLLAVASQTVGNQICEDEAENCQLCKRTSCLQEHMDNKAGRSSCRRERTFVGIALQKYTSVKP